MVIRIDQEIEQAIEELMPLVLNFDPPPGTELWAGVCGDSQARAYLRALALPVLERLAAVKVKEGEENVWEDPEAYGLCSGHGG